MLHHNYISIRNYYYCYCCYCYCYTCSDYQLYYGNLLCAARKTYLI